MFTRPQLGPQTISGVQWGHSSLIFNGFLGGTLCLDQQTWNNLPLYIPPKNDFTTNLIKSPLTPSIPLRALYDKYKNAL